MTGYDWVTLTTDYGEADGYVAACQGVIVQRAPHVRFIDVSHRVPPQDVRRGAGVLSQTVPWLPPAVHVAVVDPGVGTARRGICLVAGGSALVGPDNGLLLPAAEALGGPDAGYVLERPEFWLPAVSHTFHGRDVFAPVAAHLAVGVDPAELGPAIFPADLIRLPRPSVTIGAALIESEVLSVDAFGNIQLAATAADLIESALPFGAPVTVRIGPAGRRALLGSTFGDVGIGELVVVIDSAERVAVAVNGGSAAATLGAKDGDVVVVAGRLEHAE